MKINFRRNFFERYRLSDQNAVKPQKFTDCAKIFNDCKEAEKYNNIQEDDEDDVKVGDANHDIKMEGAKQDEKFQTNETVAEEEKIEQNSENDTLKRKAKIIDWQ